MRLWNGIRSAFIWTGIATLTTAMYPVGLVAFVVLFPFDHTRRFGHWWASKWGRSIMRLNNRWIPIVREQHKLPKDRAVVLVSNHQGMGDIMMAFHLDHHFKWIAKQILFYVPFMGWFMHHAGYIPLRRGRKDSIIACMKKARAYLDSGVSVLLFPEGTRSENPAELRAFKPGAFKLAIDGQYDIVPMAISGTHDALPKNSWRYSDEVCPMKILVGDPISTKGMTEADLEKLSNHTRQVILNLKAELEGTKHAPSTQPDFAAVRPSRQRAAM
jgi:1-acyl-sn-glycerol-3-phosphate acyltransferase